MLRAIRSPFLLLALTLLIPSGATAQPSRPQVLEDGGDGRTGGLAVNEDALAPLTPMEKVSDSRPGQGAIDAYNRGLDYRDRAWKLEQEAAATDGAKAAKKKEKAQKAHQEAVKHFRKALDQEPTFYQALGSLGYALLRTGQYQEALDAYDRALASGPSYPEAIEERGEVYLGLDQIEDAKAAYMELSRADSESAAALMSAMKRWLEERTNDPGELSAETVESFAAWVEERGEAAS